MAVFASRKIVMPALPIAVTITGTGDVDDCYATINGTKQYGAGTHEVYAGDTITFGVRGTNNMNYGLITIDGAEVLRVESGSETYNWTVPRGISTIEIAMKYIDKSPFVIGQITVTTA